MGMRTTAIWEDQPWTPPTPSLSICRILLPTAREQRLEQQRRLGEASEKVAENILEDLFTTVWD